MIEVLLVHNKFKWYEPLTYLSYAIRIVTCSKWNHVAVRIGDIVIEAKGNGVHTTSYKNWLTYSDRIVLPMRARKLDLNADDAVLATEGMHYGFLDLVERFRKIIITKWNGSDNYILKDRTGVICSDLACILLEIPQIYMPSELEFAQELIRGEEFVTYCS